MSDRLIEILSLIHSLPGIERYPEIFAYTNPDHSLYPELVGHPTLTLKLLRETVRFESVEEQARHLAAIGELSAISNSPTFSKCVNVNAEYLRWRKTLDAKLRRAEERADACDYLEIPGGEWENWVERLKQTKRLVDANEENPACQIRILEAYIGEADTALGNHTDDQLKMANDLKLQVEQMHGLEASARSVLVERIEELKQDISSKEYIVVSRRLQELQAVIKSGRMEPLSTPNVGRRLPLAKRFNVLGKEPNNPISNLLRALSLSDSLDSAPVHIREIFPTNQAFLEAKAQTFLSSHTKSEAVEPGPYFKQLKQWLGIHELRELEADLPHLINSASKFWVSSRKISNRSQGHAIVTAATPWIGAPFLSLQGSPRLIAIVKPRLDYKDWQRESFVIQVVSSLVTEIVESLKQQTGLSHHERSFASEGLIVCMLPGAWFSKYQYRATFEQINWPSGLRDRIALVDDADLIRLIPVENDRRWRAFQELVLPRLTGAAKGTYRQSNAAPSHMFFGREEELSQLKEQATVVYSGRKMGKSSLLHFLHTVECGKDGISKSIWIAGSGIPPWQSWLLLQRIGSEIASIAQQLNPDNSDRFTWEFESIALPANVEEEFTLKLMKVREQFELLLSAAHQILSTHGVQRLYLLVDEADSFARAEMFESRKQSTDARHGVSWFLRDMENKFNGWLRVIFAGYDELGRSLNQPHSPFVNWRGTLRLETLDEKSGKQLIMDPLAALGIRLDEKIATRILELTGRHASLIQSFCLRLIEQVQMHSSTWPVEDMPITGDMVRTVEASQSYRAEMSETLELNLRIASAYPLHLLFFALVSPTGLGQGSYLKSPFNLDDVQRQLTSDCKTIRDLDIATLEASLQLLIQLGLLEVNEDNLYSFRARHFVSTLRTSDSLQEHLTKALDDWNRKRSNDDQLPRAIWSIRDTQLERLVQDRRAEGHVDSIATIMVVAGLPRTGREYLLESLRNAWQEDCVYVQTVQGNWVAEVAKDKRLILDATKGVHWEELRQALLARREVRDATRLVCGPETLWRVLNDFDIAYHAETIGLGPLSSNELDQWIVRGIGTSVGQVAPPGCTVRESDKSQILRETAGLLPILEYVREYWNKNGGLPDPLTIDHVLTFHKHLRSPEGGLMLMSNEFSLSMPYCFRRAIHDIYTFCQREDVSVLKPDYLSLEYLRQYAPNVFEGVYESEDWSNVLDEAKLLGLIQMEGRDLVVPFGSILGTLVTHQAFVKSKP